MLTHFKGPLKNPNILMNFSSPSDRRVFDTNVVADQNNARLSWLQIIDGFSLPYRKVPLIFLDSNITKYIVHRFNIKSANRVPY